MKFVTFEDETGIVETVFFPRAYSRFYHLLESGRACLVCGKVDKNHGVSVLCAENVQPLKYQGSGADM